MRKDYESPVSELLLIRLESNFTASGNRCVECKDTDCQNYFNPKLTE